jgi:hypothetical protein
MFGVRSASFLGVALFGATVSAAPPPSAARFEVTFSTSAAQTKLRLEGPGLAPSGVPCSSACALELQRGTYTVYVGSAGHHSSLPVLIQSPSRVEVRPPSPSQRSIGIGFVATGCVLGLAGLSAFVFDTASATAAIPGADGGDGSGYQRPAWITPVEIAGGVGVVAALVGIGLLTTNPPTAVVRLRAATSQGERSASRRAQLPLLTPVLARGSAGWRLGWRF